jgi:hypothetical protein
MNSAPIEDAGLLDDQAWLQPNIDTQGVNKSGKENTGVSPLAVQNLRYFSWASNTPDASTTDADREYSSDDDDSQGSYEKMECEDSSHEDNKISDASLAPAPESGEITLSSLLPPRKKLKIICGDSWAATIAQEPYAPSVRVHPDVTSGNRMTINVKNELAKDMTFVRHRINEGIFTLEQACEHMRLKFPGMAWRFDREWMTAARQRPFYKDENFEEMQVIEAKRRASPSPPASNKSKYSREAEAIVREFLLQNWHRSEPEMSLRKMAEELGVSFQFVDRIKRKLLKEGEL